jgi:Replication initiator protein A
MKPDTTNELAPLNPIRVETAFSRYPVHRLAKHGDIAIDIRERNEHGEVSIKWEVNHNSKYGQPGPLAYKLDTLIINRRLEEANRPISRLIRLGGLTDICRELGQTDSGGNTKLIKKSLIQNALAGITAKICYKRADGTERSLEAVFNRYNVIFTGEKLPDGRKADAVYIVLSDIYTQVISGAMTRPLDYDYLKSLTPASQRFYELISFQMYATIKHDRARARLVYSEFCKYAPLVRQFDWEKVRPQMARIHAPHRDSGYIAKIDVQDSVDSNGQPDWIMLYQPGNKARAEYRTFAKRGGPVVLEVEPFTAAPLPQFSAPEPAPLETELTGRGITQAMAAELVREHGEEKVRAQMEHLDWQMEKKPEKIADPAAWLVSAIRTGHAPPKGYKSKAIRQKEAEAKQARERKVAEEHRQKQEAAAREKAEEKAITAYWESLTAEQQAELDAAARAQANPEILALEHGPFKELGKVIRRKEHIQHLLTKQEQSVADTSAASCVSG